MSFTNGFKNELEKLAKLSPSVKAWAFSRGLTSGVAAAAMGLGLMAATSDEKKKKNLLRAALIPAMIGTSVGLGKGLAERGLYARFLKGMARH